MSRSVSMLKSAAAGTALRGSGSCVAGPLLLLRPPSSSSTLVPHASCSHRFVSPHRARSLHTSTTVRAVATPQAIQPGEQPYTFVRLRQTQEDGRSTLSPPQLLTAVQRMYDPQTHILIVKNPEGPIVEILTRSEWVEQRSKFKRSGGAGPTLKADDKMIQIRWTSATHDVDLRIRQARELLERGTRVQVAFMGKGKTAVAKTDKQALVQRFAGSLEDVGEQWREPEFQGEKGALFFQPLPDVRKGAVQALQAKSNELRDAKEAKKLEQREKHERKMMELEARKKAAQQAAAAQAAKNQKEAEELWGPTPNAGPQHNAEDRGRRK